MIFVRGVWANIYLGIQNIAVTYLGPCQTSTVEILAKEDNG